MLETDCWCVTAVVYDFRNQQQSKNISRKKNKKLVKICLIDGVAQLVRAPNSNRRVATPMPTLGITRCCLLEKDLTLSSQQIAVQLNG